METKIALADERQRQSSSNLPLQRMQDVKPVVQNPSVAASVSNAYTESPLSEATSGKRTLTNSNATVVVTDPGTVPHIMHHNTSVKGREAITQVNTVRSSVTQSGGLQTIAMRQNLLHAGGSVHHSASATISAIAQESLSDNRGLAPASSSVAGSGQNVAYSSTSNMTGGSQSFNSTHGFSSQFSTSHSGNCESAEVNFKSSVHMRADMDDRSARSSPNLSHSQARSARSTPSATNSSRVQYASLSEASGSPLSTTDSPAAPTISLLRSDAASHARVVSSTEPRRSGVISRVDPRSSTSGVPLRPSLASMSSRVIVTTGPNGTAVFPCPQCGKQFTNSSAIAKHKLTHSDERRYSCAICSKAFKRQDHLNGHMMTHQDKKPHQCTFPGCAKSYSDARSLRRHLEHQHQNDIRTIISNVADSPSSVTAHSTDAEDTSAGWPAQRSSVHQAASQPSVGGSGAGGALSGAESDGDTDIAQSRSAEEVSSAARLLEPTIASLAVRLLAEAQTAPRNEVLKHLDELHPQQCNVCRKRFKNQAALNGHMRLHGGFAGLPVTSRSQSVDASNSIASSSRPVSQTSFLPHGRPMQLTVPSSNSPLQTHDATSRDSVVRPHTTTMPTVKVEPSRVAFKRALTQPDREAEPVRPRSIQASQTPVHSNHWPPRMLQQQQSSFSGGGGGSQIDSLIAAAEMVANDDASRAASAHHSLSATNMDFASETVEADDGVASGVAYNEVEIVGVADIVDTDMFNTHDDLVSSPSKLRHKHDLSVAAYESVSPGVDDDSHDRRLDAVYDDEALADAGHTGNADTDYSLECENEPTLWQCVSLGQRGLGVRSPSGSVYRWTPPTNHRVGYAKPHLLPQSHWQLTTALSTTGVSQQRLGSAHCADTITALALKNVFHNASINPADETWRKRHYSAADIFADELDYSFPLVSQGSPASSLLETFSQSHSVVMHHSQPSLFTDASHGRMQHTEVGHSSVGMMPPVSSATQDQGKRSQSELLVSNEQQQHNEQSEAADQLAASAVSSSQCDTRPTGSGLTTKQEPGAGLSSSVDGVEPSATDEKKNTSEGGQREGNDADVKQLTSGIAEGKLRRANRPEPLHLQGLASFAESFNDNWVRIPNPVRTRRPSFGYQSWLRAPRSILSQSASGGWPSSWNDEDDPDHMDAHEDPHAASHPRESSAGVPGCPLKATQSLFTPPPILSPFRTGSGLYWNVLVSKSRHASAASDAAPPVSTGFDGSSELQKLAQTASEFVGARPYAQAAQQSETNLPPPHCISTRTKQLSATDSVTRESIEGLAAGSHIDDDDNETVETDIEPHINIGSRHQADVPELRPSYEAYMEQSPPERLLLDPAVFAPLSDETLESYLDTARSAVLPGNGVNTELALRVLVETNGDIAAALELLLNASACDLQPGGFSNDGFQYVLVDRYTGRALRSVALAEHYAEMRQWTAQDIAAYNNAFRQGIEKEFGEIARLTGRSVRECVEFYFVWKKAFPDDYARARRARRRKERAADSGYNLRRDDAATANNDDTASCSNAAPARVCVRCDAVFTSESALRRHFASVHASRRPDAIDFDNDASQTYEENSTLNGDIDTPDDATSVTSSYGGSRLSDLDAPGKQFSGTTSCVTDESTNQSQAHTANTSRSHPMDSAAHASSGRRHDEPSAKRRRKQPVVPRTGPFTCRICGRQFEKVKSCNAHMKSHRYHTAAST